MQENWDNLKNKIIQNTVKPVKKCPECESEDFSTDGHSSYCSNCNLILQDNYPYTAGLKYVLPYGVCL